MTASNARVQRITKEHESRYQQWQRERETYIREHGLAAWDARVEREIADLYDAREPYPMPGEEQP